jgi:hypothetical protein
VPSGSLRDLTLVLSNPIIFYLVFAHCFQLDAKMAHAEAIIWSTSPVVTSPVSPFGVAATPERTERFVATLPANIHPTMTYRQPQQPLVQQYYYNFQQGSAQTLTNPALRNQRSAQIHYHSHSARMQPYRARPQKTQALPQRPLTAVASDSASVDADNFQNPKPAARTSIAFLLSHN